MKEIELKLFLLLSQLCLLALTTLTQTRGIVTGKVTERLSGQPVAQAKLIVESINETLTDNTGRFRLELAPGTYRARIEANLRYASHRHTERNRAIRHDTRRKTRSCADHRIHLSVGSLRLARTSAGLSRLSPTSSI